MGAGGRGEALEGLRMEVRRRIWGAVKCVGVRGQAYRARPGSTCPPWSYLQQGVGVGRGAGIKAMGAMVVGGVAPVPPSPPAAAAGAHLGAQLREEGAVARARRGRVAAVSEQRDDGADGVLAGTEVALRTKRGGRGGGG